MYICMNITGNTHLELGIPQLSLQTCEIRSSTGMKKNHQALRFRGYWEKQCILFKDAFSMRIPHQNINEIFLVCNFFSKNADIVKDVLTSCDSTLDNHISGILVSGLASSAVDRGFEPRSCQTREYKIGMCCFSAKHAALRSNSKDWLARNQNNVSKWSDMSTRGLSFQ